MRKQDAFLAVMLLVFALSLPARAQEEPPPLWSGSGELSFVAISGNTDMSSLGLGAELFWKPLPWEAEFKAAFVTTKTEGEQTAEALNAILGIAREINPRTAGYGRANWMVNTFAGIDSRAFLEGGLAFKVIEEDRQELRLEGGVGYTLENRVSGEDLDFATGRGGLVYRWKFSENAELVEDLSLMLNLEDADDFRIGNLVSISSRLTDLLSLKLSHALNFYNEPVEGFGDTDQIVSAAIVAKW
ncbi:MAG: YdiY family protein, partial [Thermoanaerobaculia bacterium]